MARQVWKINKFEGGLNDYSDPKDIRANEFSNIEDVYISKAGSISPLGHALNNVTDIDKLNLTGTSADLIAGKGFLWYRSDSSYETIPTIGTTITKTSSSAASDGQKARMIFTIDTLVWLFYHTDNYYEHLNIPTNFFDKDIMEKSEKEYIKRYHDYNVKFYEANNKKIYLKEAGVHAYQ